LPDWLGVDAIGHATAQAAACDGSGYIGHAPKTLLTPAFAGSECPSEGDARARRTNTRRIRLRRQDGAHHPVGRFQRRPASPNHARSSESRATTSSPTLSPFAAQRSSDRCRRDGPPPARRPTTTHRCRSRKPVCRTLPVPGMAQGDQHGRHHDRQSRAGRVRARTSRAPRTA
jgi:hypothetical protein